MRSLDMPGGSGQNYTANPSQPRVQALPQSNLCLQPLTLDYYCCGHWICRAVPGRITPQLKSNLVSKASVRLLITYVSSKSKSPLYILLSIFPSSQLHVHQNVYPILATSHTSKSRLFACMSSLCQFTQIKF